MTRLYQIWRGMCRRCHDRTRPDFAHYGARGIRVCEEWRGSSDLETWTHEGFKAFEAWAMTHGYTDDKTLDRVSNNKGYGPGNVRWVSKKAQAHNRSTNEPLTYNDKTMARIEWSR